MLCVLSDFSLLLIAIKIYMHMHQSSIVRRESRLCKTYNFKFNTYVYSSSVSNMHTSIVNYYFSISFDVLRTTTHQLYVM